MALHAGAFEVLRAKFAQHGRIEAREAGEEKLDLADWLRGVANMKASPAVQKALSVGTATAGGYTVPNLLQAGILEALVPVSALMRAGVGMIELQPGQTTTFAPNARRVAIFSDDILSGITKTHL